TGLKTVGVNLTTAPANPKSQIPNPKPAAGNSKIQNPNPTEIESTKDKIPNGGRHRLACVWDFSLGISLGFVICNLEFPGAGASGNCPTGNFRAFRRLGVPGPFFPGFY